MNLLFFLVPAASVIALFFAWFFFHQMMKESEGTVTMKEIAQYVREGAMAYLKQQYKVVTIVFLIIAAFFAVLAYGFHIQNPWVPFAFLTGGFFSGLAGFIGMKTATYASARTANAVTKSLNSGLKLDFNLHLIKCLNLKNRLIYYSATWLLPARNSRMLIRN